MESMSVGPSKLEKSHVDKRKLCKLTIVGGAAFWATNFAISLTPIAAEYRDALSISYFPMIVESLLGGLIIGFFVSLFLLRFFDRIPTDNPIVKSVIISIIGLVLITLLLQVPVVYSTPNDALRYFLIGTMFNVIRILALGITIGYLFKRLV
jgi:hypothetical protein